MNLQLQMVVRDRLYLRLTLTHFGIAHIDTNLALTLAADFADMFEVRGHRRRLARGHSLAPKESDHEFVLAYVGEDGRLRQTSVWLAPMPEQREVEGDRISASWPVSLAPGEEVTFGVAVEPRIEDDRAPKATLESAAAASEREWEEWK